VKIVTRSKEEFFLRVALVQRPSSPLVAVHCSISVSPLPQEDWLYEKAVMCGAPICSILYPTLCIALQVQAYAARDYWEE